MVPKSIGISGGVNLDNIIIHFRDNWGRFKNTFCRGRALVNGIFLEGGNLAELFNDDDFEDRLNSANGFWGFLKKFDNGIVIGSDRIRSYPFFYGLYENTAYISDDPYWVKDQVNEYEMDEFSKNEFLLTGYVTGRDTLYKGVKQILPGELVYFNVEEDSQINIKNIRYYNYIHRNYYKELSRKELLDLHDNYLFNGIKRLIEYANGRTIVIPLSGGFDSRVIASCLKKLEYKNIITFSYGKRNNPEAIKSREVAEKLNLKWLFIPYDNKKTYEWYNSDLRKSFSKFGDCLSTILPDREWPAILELKRLKIIQEDSVFAPGHSGNFTSGGYIPYALTKKDPGKDGMVKAVLKAHYVMWGWKGYESIWKKGFIEKIFQCANCETDGIDTAANLYEKWSWQENEIKRMVNAVKVYDFFGYDYWLPFWDYDYMDFWCRVPLCYRIQKNLYNQYAAMLYSNITGVTFEDAKVKVPNDNLSSVAKGRRSIKNLFLNTLIKSKTRLQKDEHMENDWEQSLGRLSKEVYKILLPYMAGRSSCATLERLGLISFTDSKVKDSTIDMLRIMKG